MLYIDIETYSDVDLKKAGVYRYVESPNFEILFAWYAVDDGPLELALGQEVWEIPGLWDEGVKCAHNAPFERICFSAHADYPVGEYLPPSDWNDTAALGAVHGYPRSLDGLSRALGVSMKDSAGTALINWFCKPDRNGKRRMPQDHPEKWAQFLEYGRQDVVVLRDIERKLPAWPQGEWDAYVTDQLINDRGVQVDLDMAHAAVRADTEGRAEASTELEALLGIANAGSVPQLTKGLSEIGLEVSDLRQATIEALLAGSGLTEPQRRALELRQLTALVAARKYQAAIDMCSSDGRLRGQFRYFGAHTGRWSSRGVQIQNLPRIAIGLSKERIQAEGLTGQDDRIERRGELLTESIILDLLMGVNPGPEMIKALVRSLFIGPFTVVDYNAIEARFLAWLAGEEWMLEAFRAKRDIYVETAARMSEVGSREYPRQDGKIAVLLLGYQGGVEPLRKMMPTSTDDELREIRDTYRAAIPKIKRLWSTMERAFLDGGQAGRLQVKRRGADRHVILPSGRAIVYHGVVVRGSGWDRRIMFDDPKTGFKSKTDTYGGRLVENATQGGCRDLLAVAMAALESEGYPTVLHVHDEAGVEGIHSVERIAEIMCRLPAWAKGLPLDAAGFQCTRYRKG